MTKCNQFNCKGEFVEDVSKYGPYWKCTVCGHKIDKKCFCDGQRVMSIYNGSVGSDLYPYCTPILLKLQDYQSDCPR